MSSVSSRACDVILQEADITSLRKLIVVSAIASASSKKYMQLEEIADIDKGKTGIKDAQPGPFPLVVTAEARATCDHFDFEGPAILIPMVSSTGHGDASLKRIHYQEGKYAVGTILAVLRIRNDAEFSARFVYQYLSAFKDELLVSRMVGTANVSLTLNKLRDVSVPVLPIEKQREVEKLMHICDRLEARQADAENAHAQLVEALLGSLTQARDANDFATNWQRLSQHFHTLFTTESSIDALKQAVLQLAVTGRLVPQDPNDDPASIQYSRSLDLPKGYARSGKQSIKDKPISDQDDLPSIPDTWIYKTIDQLYGSCHLLDYADGNHGSFYPRKEEFSDEGVLFLTAAQITTGGSVLWKMCPRLSGEKAGQLTKGWAKTGDVFYTHNATVGRTALASAGPEDDFLLGTSVTFYRVNNGAISSSYLYRYFSSPSWAGQADLVMRQTTRNQVSITKQALFFVALPPLAEQHRIAPKIDQLMALCDQLKSRLTQARQLNQQLASTLVEQAVA